MFIPTTKEEFRALGWQEADIILVSGDIYIDVPSSGVSLIGHVLIEAGFRVGIIAQPALDSKDDISALGEPRLFWGITAGAVDSMVSNYNANRSRRIHDDLTSGGANNSRPDRASIAYTGLIRRYFKNTVPIVLGGIEASLRRIAHYDYWQNKIRRSLLFDAKADLLVYGMGEITMRAIAERLSAGEDYLGLPGLCYIAEQAPEGALMLPSFEEAEADTAEGHVAFERMFRMFYDNAVFDENRILAQKHGARFLVHNPPCRSLTTQELDAVCELPYERDVHPRYAAAGKVRALDTVRFSITTHRGCFGGCNFCSIAVHQGRRIVNRSAASIIREARAMSRHNLFKGVISDVGGASANMYGMDCSRAGGPCVRRSCLGESPCRFLNIDHSALIRLLEQLRNINSIKHVFTASGLRYDLILADKKNGVKYLKALLQYHVSGLMRIAPEHTVGSLLELMGKPSFEQLKIFRLLFEETVEQSGKRSGLSYYFMAAHPGCSLADMVSLQKTMGAGQKPIAASVQIFTPTPSTFSTLMYYTKRNPFTGEPLFVEKEMGKKQKQKRQIKVF